MLNKRITIRIRDAILNATMTGGNMAVNAAKRSLMKHGFGTRITYEDAIDSRILFRFLERALTKVGSLNGV